MDVSGRYLLGKIGILGFLIFILASSVVEAASNQQIVYQGRILKPDGSPEDSNSVAFTLSIYSSGTEKCLLYSEKQTLNMSDSVGAFTLNVGNGTRTDGGSYTFNQAFINAGTLSGLTCAIGTTYSPAASDDRVMYVSFNDGSGLVKLGPQAIKSVPFALQAGQIGGYGITNLVRISGIGSMQTLAPGQVDQIAALPAIGT